MLYIPAHIHVDPNMHPGIYRSLLHFAVVFDKVSLYAVSGHYLEYNLPKGFEIADFIKLNLDPSTSPFLLTGPTNWFDKNYRQKRLEGTAVTWHDFYDGEITKLTTRGDISFIEVPTSQDIRERAWRIAESWHNYFVSHGINIPDYEGPGQVAHRAYMEAYDKFRADKAKHARQVNTLGGNLPAELVFDEQLPATFYHAERHRNEPSKGYRYHEFLAEGDILSLLIFEHATKPSIRNAINEEIGKRGLKYKFGTYYIAGDWHKLLMQARELQSTAELVDYKIELAGKDEALGSLLAKVLHENIGDLNLGRTGVEDILRFRQNGGPERLRAIIAECFDRIVRAGNDGEAIETMRASIDKVKALCQQHHTRVLVENCILAVIYFAAPIAATLAGHSWSTAVEEASYALSAAAFSLIIPENRKWVVDNIFPNVPTGDQNFFMETIDSWLISAQPNKCTPSPLQSV